MHGAEKVARATFVRKSSRQDDAGLLVMQANYTFNCNRDTAIELLPPNNRVKFLYQVEIGTTFYWALNQLMKKPKSLQKPAKQLKADGIHLTAKHLQKTNASQPAKGSALGQKSGVDVTQKQRTLESQFAKGSAQKTKSTVADIPATTSLKKTIDPPSKQGGQKRKMDPYDTAKFSQPTAKPKVDDSQRNKKGTARKGWKGYVEMSREEFERDLALKEMDEYRALPHKRGRKPKIDSIYVV